MYVTYAVMSMTRQRATLMAVSLPEQRSKTFPRTGYAPSAELARVIFRLSMTN